MSILSRTLSGAIVCALAFVGGGAFAQATNTALFIQVAQTEPEQQTDQAMRRLNHYSERALVALRGYGTGANSEADIKSVREKVKRLLDAGQRSGLDLVATASYFEAFISGNSGAPLPTALLDTSGRFNTRELLESVALYYDQLEPQEFDFAASDEADLAAIRSVAQRNTSQAPEAQPADLVVAEQPVIVLELPAIAPNAPANVRAILERVQLRDEDWVITVQPGDSLAQYANALYGDSRLFPQIFEANLAVLVSPSSIAVGQALVLPKG